MPSSRANVTLENNKLPSFTVLEKVSAMILKSSKSGAGYFLGLAAWLFVLRKTTDLAQGRPGVGYFLGLAPRFVRVKRVNRPYAGAMLGYASSMIT